MRQGLWIRGHIPFVSVLAGDPKIHVVCNPLSYPMTRFRRRVGIKVVEIPS
jgi:hypothetical protein